MQILVGGLQGIKGCVRGAIVDCRGRRAGGNTNRWLQGLEGCGRAAEAEQLLVAGAGGPAAMPILVGGLQGLKGCVRGAIVDCRGWRAGGNANRCSVVCRG